MYKLKLTHKHNLKDPKELGNASNSQYIAIFYSDSH